VLALAVAALALGVALRFLTSSHLWLDEALTVNIARLPLSKIPDALRHDGSPPLYYMLLHVWMGLFGSGDFAVRALSGVLSAAALPLIWVAGRKIGGRRAAVAAVILLGASPFAIRFGTEARMYSLLGLLALAGLLIVHHLLERPSAGGAIGLAVITGLLLLTHYWALYFVAAVGILLAARLVRARDRGTILALAGLAASGLFLVPWLPVFTYQLAHTGTPWAAAPRFAAIIETVRQWAGGGSDPGEIQNLLFVFLVALALFGTAVNGRRIELDLRTRPGVRGLAVVSFVTLLIALAAALASGSAYVVRYTSVAFPLFLLVVAFGTLAFADNRIRCAVLAVAVVLGFISAVPNTGGRRTQAGVVARALNRSAQRGDVVVYCPDQLGPSVSRLVTAPVVQLTFPRSTPPEFVDWVDYAAHNRAARTAPFAEKLAGAPGPHRIWLVWSPGYKTFGSKCSLLVDRLKALRPHMTRVVRVSLKYEERMGLVRYDPG
jgi:uncharacterized membrane protein